MIKPMAQITHICLLAVLLLAGFISTEPVAGAPPPEQTSDKSAEVMNSHEDGAQVAAPREWTMVELQAAKPYPAPHVEGEPSSGTPAPTGPAGLEQGSLPLKAPTTETPTEVIPNDNAAQALEPEVPYTYSTFPFSTVGMLFFTRDGKDYVCSAAVIKNQSIWTAGHCLHNGRGSIDGWSNNVVFVPQYLDGRAPLGQWRVQTLLVPRGWYDGQDGGQATYNFGGGILSEPIGHRTGWLGFAWNQPFGQTFTAIGYPWAPINGERMHYCLQRTEFIYFAEISTITCNSTGGWIGAPWLTNFVLGSAGEMNYLTGITTMVGENSHSPQFNDYTKSFYDTLY